MEFMKSKELLIAIVESIADVKEGVSVTETTDDLGVLLEVKVAKEDMGKIIGKDGLTAQAIRNIVRVVGMKDKARVSVKIVEPDN